MVVTETCKTLSSETNLCGTSLMTCSMNTELCSCWCCSTCLERQEHYCHRKTGGKLAKLLIPERESRSPILDVPITSSRSRSGRPVLSLSINKLDACDCDSSAIDMGWSGDSSNLCMNCQENQNLSSVSDPGYYLSSRNGISSRLLSGHDNGVSILFITAMLY